MVNGLIQQSDITITNTQSPNIGKPTRIKEILTDIKREIENNNSREL